MLSERFDQRWSERWDQIDVVRKMWLGRCDHDVMIRRCDQKDEIRKMWSEGCDQKDVIIKMWPLRYD